jgi:hypothetical protein
MKLLAVCLLALTFAAATTAATPKPKPWQWTTAQASSALMRQAEDFYVVGETTRDLTRAVCRGKGKAVQRRFLAFTCTATVSGSIAEGTSRLRVAAKTRKADGLCWAVAPASIPSGCFAPGKRAEGSPRDAWVAAYRVIDDRNVQGGGCLAHGSGFFSCSWTDAQGEHRGTVTFKPLPVVKVLS